MKQLIEAGSTWLNLSHVEALAAGELDFLIKDDVRQLLEESRAWVDKAVAEKRVIYGITTGFGALQRVQIPPEDLGRLQHNLLVSHAVSTGDPLPDDVVRTMLLLRAQSLAQGNSGVRPCLIERLLDFLRKDLIPQVPALGSVGASGDLSPLSHMALPVIGEGFLKSDGEWRPAREVLNQHRLEPMSLLAKEGLALNNGTQFMTASAALLLIRARKLARMADIALALSLEAFQGKSAAFDPRLHQLRPHPGQILSARNIRRMVEDSTRVDRPDEAHARVQDSYSVRCAPQVHGSARDTIEHLVSVVEREMNAVTDNPLIFAEDNDVLSGGNFHGEPVANALDFLKIVLTELASISERRTAKLLDASQSYGLPAFLVTRGGLNSGMMICQYTAASLVSKCKTLAHPDTVDSIPTSANQEDHVSMGANAALHALEISQHLETVLSIELLAAHYGSRFREGSAGTGSRAALEEISRVIQHEASRDDEVVDHDFRAEYHAVRAHIESGTIEAAVEAVIGRLE